MIGDPLLVKMVGGRELKEQRVGIVQRTVPLAEPGPVRRQHKRINASIEVTEDQITFGDLNQEVHGLLRPLAHVQEQMDVCDAGGRLSEWIDTDASTDKYPLCAAADVRYRLTSRFSGTPLTLLVTRRKRGRRLGPLP